MILSTSERLAEYAKLMNRYGVDSSEARHFLEENRADAEFADLAELSRRLKIELQPRPLPTPLDGDVPGACARGQGGRGGAPASGSVRISH